MRFEKGQDPKVERVLVPLDVSHRGRVLRRESDIKRYSIGDRTPGIDTGRRWLADHLHPTRCARR